MAKFYGSFPFFTNLQNSFVVIEASDYDDAHKQMYQLYGNRWSMLYDEGAWEAGKFASVFPEGEVELGTPLKELSPLSGDPQYDEDDIPHDETSEERLNSPAIVVDCSNRFNVALLSGGDHLLIAGAVHMALNKEDALVLAAWLVHLSDRLPGDLFFGDVLNSVEAMDG